MNFTDGDNQSRYYSYDKWAMDIGYVPHGPVHEYIGGLGGDCGRWDSLVTRGYINETQLQSIKSRAFNVLKNLWRERLIETPEYW